jgi:nucleoside-diphosphate-sugar epimerase
MRALVLGGTGFVGRRLVETLVATGVETAMLNRGSRPAVTGDVEQLTADRTDAAAMRAALGDRQWDAVFDVSGVVQAAGGSAVEDLIEQLDGRVGRYVFVSSQSVYRVDGRFPWSEDSPVVDPDPASYAGFKVMVERTLMARHRASDFPAVIARPAAIYGPYNNIYDMEPAMFRRLLEARPILIPYGGLVVSSYGHVDDLCRSLLTMATHPGAVGETFNATTSAVTSAGYVEVLATVAGTTADVVFVPDDVMAGAEAPLCSRLFLPHHHGMVDVTKVQRRLGFVPSYDLPGGQAHTFAWLQDNGMSTGDRAVGDPMWGRSYDFAYEAQVARRLRPVATP